MGQEQSMNMVTLQPTSDQLPKSLRKRLEIKSKDLQTQISNELTDSLIEYGHRIKQWDAVQLSISDASIDGIAKAIMGIDFPHLKKLGLSSNKIQSAQLLGRINAPNLQQLFMSDNRIVSISGLRKMQSRQISKLWMVENLINRAEFCTEANWLDLRVIGIYSRIQKNRQQTVGFTAKLEHRSHEQKQHYFWIESPGQITEKPVLKSIMKKYKNKRSQFVTVMPIRSH